MRNVEKYYQAFVSSTYKDLRFERQAVMQTLLKMNCLPIGMELFPNGDPDVWKLIESLIEKCDIYILIVAGRYGTISEVDGISYTEKEFHTALRMGKRVLVYPHKSPYTHNPDASKDEKEKHKEFLAKFHETLYRRSVNPWGNLSELKENIAIDLGNVLHTLEGGWARQRYGVLDVFADEVRSLEAKFESSEVKTLVGLLQSTLQQFQFGHTESRLMQLGEIIPWLTKPEWGFLTTFARAQVMVRTDLPFIEAENQSVNIAMKRAAVDLASHYRSQLTNFERGVLEIEGELINSIAEYFILAINQSFQALSYGDFNFWNSNESKTYYENNLALIQKGVSVHRIFVGPKDEFRMDVVQSVIRKQIKDKIKVGVISSELVDELIPARLDRDFALHDNFAASFFRNYYGRIYKIDTTHQTISRFRNRFDLVAQNAELIPNKTDENKRYFESETEFDIWLSQDGVPR